MFGFGRKKIIGIEISDDQLKLVEISRRRKQKVITKYAIEDIPTGLIQNGVVQNHEEILQFFKKMRRKLKLGNRRINISINSPNILLRPVQMPKMDKKLLRKAIETEIANNIQLPFQQYTYDYTLIPDHKIETELESEEQTQEFMLIIAAKEMLETYIALFKKVKFEVVSIDLAPISFLRLLELERKEKVEQLFVGINLHQHFAEVSIFSNAILRLSRNISFYPQSYVMPVEEVDGTATTTINYEAYNADLVREVERILNFFRYTLHHREQLLGEVVLAGNLPHETEPITTAFSTYFQAPTSILSTHHLSVHNKIVRSYAKQVPMLAIPVGLALKDVKV